MIVLIFSIGIWMIVRSINQGEALVTICGTVFTAFVGKPIDWVLGIRKANQNLRLLEIVVASAKNPDQVASALLKIYAQGAAIAPKANKPKR